LNSTKPSNEELAAMFDEIADLLEIKGENPFKTRAYRRASEAILQTDLDLANATEAQMLEIPGIGDAIAAKIAERVKTGKLQFLERIYDSVPRSSLELLKVAGIGAKTAGKLVSEGISSRAELERAAGDGRLEALVGAKTARRIKDELKKPMSGRP
jgi:DNA polymerase (family 10)